jgi:hypothetical protein
MAECPPTKKISELVETTDFDGTEVFQVLDPFNQKATLSNIRDFIYPDTEVIINSIDDFPAPVGGVITLENKAYKLNSLIITTNRFLVPPGGFTFITSTIGTNALVYVGGGTMVSGVDIALFGSNIATFIAPGGKIFDFDGSGTLLFANSVFQDCVTVGDFNIDTTTFFFCQILDFTNGLLFGDRTDLVQRRQASMSNTSIFGADPLSSTPFIRATGNLRRALFTGGSCDSAGPNNVLIDFDESLRANDTQINVQWRFDTRAGGEVFAAGSLKQDYLKAKYFGCLEVADSTVSIQMGMENKTDVTTINTAGVREVINARLSNQLSERMVSQDFLTFDNSTNTITARLPDAVTAFDHGLVDGVRVNLKAGPGASLPPELDEDTDYFVVSASLQTFQLSLTLGGPAIGFTTNGVGQSYYRHETGINAASWIVLVGEEASKIGFNGSFSFLTVSGQDRIVHADVVKLDADFNITTDLDLFGKGSITTVNATDSQASSLHGVVELDTDESVRFFVTNETDTTNVIATDSNITFLLA